MAKKQQPSRGEELASRLFAAIQTVRNAPRPGARDLPCLSGVTRNGVFTYLQENVLQDSIEILDEAQSLDTVGVKDGSTLLLSRRRRRPVR